jgi:hypothetical protein
MKTKAIFYAVIALVGLFLIACSKDAAKDTTGPVITLTEPEAGEAFTAGDPDGVHLEFDLEDESGINQYKIDIHYGGGHSHNIKPTAAGVSWSYQKVYDDRKGQLNAHIHIHSEAIPADAQLGDYHLGISATDIHGNESHVYATFTLVDTPTDHDED